MPENVFTILKLKKKSATYILTIDSNSTLKDVKTQLANIIQQSGGLSTTEDATEDEEGVEDIEIPEPDFIEEDGIEAVESENKLDIDEIRLAVPNDTSDPYSNNWREIKDDDSIRDFNFKDYDIIAFAYGAEDEFEITEPAFEDN